MQLSGVSRPKSVESPRLWRRGSLAVLLVVSLAPLKGNAVDAPLRACLSEAAARFSMPEDLLRAILLTESGGNCRAHNKANANGTRDIGCMQINSSWIPVLRSRFGIDEADLFEPCVNVAVGAWILAKNFKTHGRTWRAVGAYNAVTESKRVNYAWKVHSALAR